MKPYAANAAVEPAPARTKPSSRRSTKTLLLIAGAVSLLHVANFLNYSVLRFWVDFTIARPAILIVLFFCLLPGGLRYLGRYHFRFNAGIYAFCALCFATVVLSGARLETLKYSIWLLLSVFVVLELSRRVTTVEELKRVLFIVLAPALLLSAAFNIIFGAQVLQTGRVYGALGTIHSDAALALDFMLLLFAARLVRSPGLRPSRSVRLLGWFLFFYAGYVIVFALTRSVWLGTTLGAAIYVLMASRVSERTILGVTLLLAVFSTLALVVDPGDFVPQSVQDRIALTERRVESGVIDPRIVGIKMGFDLSLEQPQGFGYAAGVRTHNTYMDILVAVGYPGMLIFLAVIARSMFIVARRGRQYLGFFAVGALGLLIHAFFETQTTAGQINFLPLLLWYGMSRSRLILTRTGKR